MMARWQHDSVLHMPSPEDDNTTVGREVPRAVVLGQIGKASMNIFDAAYCMVAYLEHDEKHFIALGFEDGVESEIAHLPEGIGLLGQLWEEGQGTIRLDNIAKHRKSSGCPHGHPMLEAFLGTQICFDQQVLGVIYLSKAPGGGSFSATDATTLEVLASACAVELSNAHIFEQLKDAYDDLETRTGELNKANVQLRKHEHELETSGQALDRANKQLKLHAIDLELLNDELVLANRAKDQFLANTSHELRTPLNAIIGFSDLLSDKRLGELNSKQQRYVGHISSSGKRLLGIINALLDISKIESGMMEIDESVFSPADISQQLMSELKPLADHKDIEFVLGENIDAGLCIQSDKDKVHQILINLLGNAIKFTPEKGRVELLLSVSQAERPGDECRLCCRISDNGIGIAIEDQERVFMPFIQASGGIARSHEGTGLGLSLSKHMVELLGGDIRVESQPDQGSTFFISLPVAVSYIESDVVKDMHAPTAVVQNAVLADIEEAMPDDVPRPVIMIVDEDGARADAVRHIFAGEGYQVICTGLSEVNQVAASANLFLIILGVPDNSEGIYARLQTLKRFDAINKIPTILLAGDAAEPRFTTGGMIGQIKDSLDRYDLLEMVSHYGMHIPKPPSAPTVLVVDDDLSVREYLKETLVAEGYHVLLAGNGVDGVCIAIERDPDLIILDLMMPGTTGFEVVNRLREHPSACDIPVVIFTAKDLSRTEALMLGQDVERILVKGVSNRQDVLHQLHKLELLYPVRAKLMDTKLDCFNFRYMQRRLDHEVARSIRYGHCFSLIAWEMDGFDQYCKKYGRRWGVAALKSSVAILHSIIRKGDVLSRMDDDRLMLLVPGLSMRESYCVAEKIRLRISHQRLPLPNNAKAKLTVSIGAVGSNESQDSHALMESVKSRVQIAVSEGGNRIVMED
ncbi:MAG: ATP-binding protein [Mariprofundus sp.]|nr:ATP-binding protein [Mariprofundus sp.]